MLRPSVRGKPGGSGFFYQRARCDVDTCANAMADAPAVTWSLIRQHTNTDTKYKGNRHAHNGNATAAATSATAAAAAVATVVAAAEDAAVSTPVPPVDPFPHLLDWVQNKGRELASKWAHAAHPRTDQSQAHQVITSTLKTQDLHYPQNHRHSLPLNPETFIPTPKSRNLNPLSLNPTSSTQNPKP